uniref:Uncharacterized protein n=1 Tax=Trichobilharzia regenti TaxID=157069 RepID=A0AA85JL55_TRIRE|nr:unnamed protein product [Trichobilharzia regenti]
MNASAKTVFICFSVTILLCHFNKCKSTETRLDCKANKQFLRCVYETKTDILKPTPNPQFNLSSMKYAVNMTTSNFSKACLQNKVCTVKILLCYIGDQLQAEWRHCYNQEEMQVLQAAYGYLDSVRQIPMEFDLEEFSSLA